MGGVFNRGNTNNIAKINDYTISTQDFIDHLNRSNIDTNVIKENIDDNILEEYDGLTFDPASPNYFAKRIGDRWVEIDSNFFTDSAHNWNKPDESIKSFKGNPNIISNIKTLLKSF